VNRRLVGAAAIALMGVLAGCAASAQPSSSGAPPYQGHRWRITEVKSLRAPSYDIRLSSADHAWIAFDGRHRLTAYDLVQRYALSYRATEEGFLPDGYRGTAGWMTSQHEKQISNAVTSVIGDRFHPVKVDSLSDGSITLTAFFHDAKSDTEWHPVVRLICRRDDSLPAGIQAPSDSTSSPSS
jgi:hypothetical protein